MEMSEKIYSPFEYLKMMTGEEHHIVGINPVQELEDFLDDYFGQGCYWSFCLEDKDYCDKEGIPVVLVDVSYYEGNKLVVLQRYFEVDSKNPEDKEAI